MGNLLPAPITDKETQTGEGNGLVYGTSTMQGWRKSMEDAHIASISPIDFPSDVSFFAVCDGHGGKQVSALAVEKLTHVMGQIMRKNKVFTEGDMCPQAIGASMREAYLVLDTQIMEESNAQTCGSTSISAIITSKHIIVANVGDSRTVLGKDGKTVPMSFDHKPANAEERNRIVKAGGIVRNNRVNGDLAVSRSLGDFVYKKCADLPPEKQQVSAEADIKIEPRDGTEEFLILACDGIWDVLSNDGICQLVRDMLTQGEKDMGLIAEDIVDTCLKRRSRDNMSIVLIRLPGAKIGAGGGIAAIRRRQASSHRNTIDLTQVNSDSAA